MTHFLAKELAFKSDVSMPWQDYIPLKKINLLSEFADMNVEESEVYFIMLLLSRFSRVRLCATPETAAHQAPPSPGFSRQEHWSGLPFPSPMHESEKWKWKVKVKSLSCVRPSATPWTAAYQAPPSMGFSRQEYWSGVPLPSPIFHYTFVFNPLFKTLQRIPRCIYKPC